MSAPMSLPELARQINAQPNKVLAGRLMIEAKAALLVAGSSTWTKWAAANLERSPKACQRAILAAREADTLAARDAVVARADAVLAACPPPGPGVLDWTEPPEAEPDTVVHYATPVEPEAAEPPGEDEPTVAETDVDLNVAELSGNSWNDLAEATEPPAVVAEEPAPGGKSSSDAPASDDAPESALEPATGGEHLEPVANTSEPEPPPRQCVKLADLWQALSSPRLRAATLLLAESQLVENGLFIADLQARQTTLAFRCEASDSTPEVRAAFVAWARQLGDDR
jgi:hypothetical protein